MSSVTFTVSGGAFIKDFSVTGCRVTVKKTSVENMISSEGKTTCFVCNLPIQSHQVGLVWQGGNGVDDLLREQVNQDIIRGRLGRGHRRDSSAQMTTIDPDDCVGLYGSDASTPPMTGKRRRSSLAHLGDLIHSWTSRDKRDGEVRGRQDRRGTLQEHRSLWEPWDTIECSLHQ